MGSGQSAPTLPAAPTMPSPTSMTTSSLSPSSVAPPPNKCTDPEYPEFGTDGPNGETCFKKCPDGYYRFFGVCIPNGTPVPVKRDPTPRLQSPCPPGKILEFGWCISPCPKDMKGDPEYCFGGDPNTFKPVGFRNVPLPK